MRTDLDHDGQQPAILRLLVGSLVAIVAADDPLDPNGQLGSIRGQPFTSFRGENSTFGRLTVFFGDHGFAECYVGDRDYGEGQVINMVFVLENTTNYSEGETYK